MSDPIIHLHNPDRVVWCRMFVWPDDGTQTTSDIDKVTCRMCPPAYERRRDLCRWCGLDAFFDGGHGWKRHQDHYICPACMRRRMELDTNGYPFVDCCTTPNFIEIQPNDRIRTHTGRFAIVQGNIASHSAVITWDDNRTHGTQRLGRHCITEVIDRKGNQ